MNHDGSATREFAFSVSRAHALVISPLLKQNSITAHLKTRYQRISLLVMSQFGIFGIFLKVANRRGEPSWNDEW